MPEKRPFCNRTELKLIQRRHHIHDRRLRVPARTRHGVGGLAGDGAHHTARDRTEGGVQGSGVVAIGADDRTAGRHPINVPGDGDVASLLHAGG